MQTCPSCGQENPDGFRLCGMCGAALTAAAPAAREERKVVTILFTDLVGSTAQAEQLDPEDVRRILSPYYSRLRSEIERHGGTVEKFIGDAVMAVFGAPVAHEDDPERAVRAALAIRDALADSSLQIRTAVNTGEALVALGARPVEGEGMVSGDVVNTTARLQNAAPVNGILVGETTYRATRTAIDYRETESVVAKGKAAPIAVWEVIGARGSFGSDIEERLRTPLVGRERERALLADALVRTRSEQSVQLVTLVGVPGIGKSRLVAELMQIADADPELITWRQGRSLPYGESTSFWALGEIVKSQAGILESDDAETAAAKLNDMLESVAPGDAWLAEHVRPLAGLAGEQTDRATAFSAWRRLFEASAEQRPLVLVFEDLHWADDGLLDFVDHLADWATTVPLLIVGTARPELLDRRPGWGGGKRNAFTVSIGALSDDETATLLHALLDRAVLPADVQQAVLRRAEGNPLYAEEYVRMLDEHEGGDLPLPESVQGVIAARIDGLAAEQKALLQDAAVIGKVFWPGSIGASDEHVLHSLERKEFIRRDRRSSIGGETQYVFLHALVRDVAYGQIPRAERVERHRRAATWLSALSTDRSEDRAELLAHHYREALALAEAAGVDASDLREPALRAFTDAAERADALNAWATAAEFVRSALVLTTDDDPLRPRLQLLLADVRAKLDDPDLELALEARDAFLARGDVESAARAAMSASFISFHLGMPVGTKYAREAVQLVADRPPSQLQAMAYSRLARRTTLGGDPHQGVELARRALALAEQFADDRIASDALNTLGIARSDLGDEAGLEDLREAIARAERGNAPHEGAMAWNNLMNCLWKFGRLEEGAECHRACIELSTRYGYTASLRWAEAEAVIDRRLRGYFREVIELADRILEQPDAAARYMVVASLSNRAIAHAVLGSATQAVADTERTLERAREMGDGQLLGPALSDRALVLFLTNRGDEALASAAELLADRRLLAYESYYGSLPLVLLELGQGERYREAVLEAGRNTLWTEAGLAIVGGEPIRGSELLDRIGARFEAAWARLLAAERGDPSQLERARAYFAEEGATPFLRRCEALLSASA
jgi:class 3 adenylate cyclase/tetratricopeptide (TPR) repeat protein